MRMSRGTASVAPCYCRSPAGQRSCLRLGQSKSTKIFRPKNRTLYKANKIRVIKIIFQSGTVLPEPMSYIAVCVCVHTCVCKHTLESEQFHTECWPLGSSTESQGRSAERRVRQSHVAPPDHAPAPANHAQTTPPPRHSHVQTTPLTCQTTPMPRPSCPDHAQPRQTAPHHAPATPKTTPRHARPRPQAGRAPELSEEGHVRARRVPSPTRPADGSCEPPTPPRGWDKPRLDDDLRLRGSEGALFKVLGRRGKDPFLSEPYAHMAVNVEGLVFASVGHTRIKRP